jgi:DNA repair protein RadB
MEEAERITTGSAVFDDLLNGGYETDIVTTVFGPSASGKSNLAMLAAASHADGKVVFVDTESGLSVRRLQQLSEDAETVLENTMVLQPSSLDEQGAAFERLKNTLNESVNLVVVDSIAMLYRLEIAKHNDVKSTNQQLAEQIANLIRIARDKTIPVLITNQVYNDFDEDESVNLVGGDILKYGSKCLIELQRDGDDRYATVRKHRSMREGKSTAFRIVDEGLVRPSND